MMSAPAQVASSMAVLKRIQEIMFASLWQSLKRVQEIMFASLWQGMNVKAIVYWLITSARVAMLHRGRDKLRGRVLEVGSGDGGQLVHLCGPAAPNVREVVCCEPNKSFHAELRRAMEAARLRAAASGIDVQLRIFAGTLHELVAAEPTARFDVIATWLVLCSVPNVEEAVRDCAALLKSPGGHLMYLEHVAGASAAARAFQRLNQYTYWWLIGDGCQLCRDTTGALDAVTSWRRTHHERRAYLGGLFPMVCGVCEAT